jgi:hypothetical protein
MSNNARSDRPVATPQSGQGRRNRESAKIPPVLRVSS